MAIDYSTYGMGYIPDIPTHPAVATRPLLRATPLVLPDSVDLRPMLPPVYDQGRLGSCTANAVAGMVQYQRMREGLHAFTPSRLFNYYFSRKRFGGENSDQGSYLAYGLASTVYEGICAEDAAVEGQWLYDPARVDISPDGPAIYAAKHHQANWYWKVGNDVLSIMHALARSLPVCFGCSVYPTFFGDWPGGVIQLPQPGQTPAGGHAMLIVGYDAGKQCWLVRNSWGNIWCLEGYCWLPWSYPINDLWVIAHER